MKHYCPFCRKDVEYKIEKRKISEFKGVEIDSYESVAVCNICNQDLYIDEIEIENNQRIYKAYRKKANIISPKDIIGLRKKYNISQRELTAILGFGKMTINRYERGGVPTKSQSDYIKPDIYNGYKSLDLEKVENIISYIASKVNNLTITSLNKYLWYIDMLSFNQRTVSITGLTYQNQKFGPTIIDKKYDEISLLNDKYNREDFETENGNTTKIISNDNYSLDMISESEKEIIDTIIKKLKNKNVTEISDLSHKEEGWKKTKRFEIISFEYAMDLKGIK